jgi:chaperonin GroEL
MPTYRKVKDADKIVLPKSPLLTEKVLHTMKRISDIVGATLGPGGQPVLIERQDNNLPSMVTKDGVTVFRSLGFRDEVEHEIMSTARDAAVRTASEAGDGTTTATILSEAIVRRTNQYCKANPRVSPQRVVRKLEQAYRELIAPALSKLAIDVDFSSESGRNILHAVAKVSANGDTDLADAVLKCFDAVGDDGNVTIIEMSGPSHYEVERLEGYPVGMGYEESCGRYFPSFINDQATQRILLEKPRFILYYGTITSAMTMALIGDKIYNDWQEHGTSPNVVFVANGFSDEVLGVMMHNFLLPNSICPVPLLVPKGPFLNYSMSFLQDLKAFTGATIFDPANRPLESAELEDLGHGIESFEASRYRSNIIGNPDESSISLRVEELEANMANPESELERQFLQERIGKLTGGIAKLKVIGASNGELREKRDRAEDAVMSIRGAIRNGALPGGGWSLIYLAKMMSETGDPILNQILGGAFREPVFRLLSNIGADSDEIDSIVEQLEESVIDYCDNDYSKDAKVYDADAGQFTYAMKAGLLDSVPAVRDAIKNAISIASLLGTLGGAVVFGRDQELERSEAKDSLEFQRTVAED